MSAPTTGHEAGKHGVRLDEAPEGALDVALLAQRAVGGPVGALDPTTPEGALARAAAVAAEVWRLEVREEAQRQRRAVNRPQVPAPVPLGVLLAEPDEDTMWRIEGLWPAGGRVVLAAQRKAGKTTTVANLLRALADGEAFLGRFEVTPPQGRVVVLDFEMTRTQLRTWLRDIGVNSPGQVEVWPLRGRAAAFDILDPAVRREWATRLRELGTEVLVVDPLRPILDALGLDENREAGRFLEALDALMVEAGIGELILVHHAGHSGERSRGDSRLRDWPDAEWRLVREVADEPGQEPGPDARRYFAAEGRDVAVPESLLDFDPATRRLSLVGGNRRQTRADTLVPAVVELVATQAPEGQPGWSGRAVEKAMTERGHGRNDVRAALRRAVEVGQVVIVTGARNARLHVPSRASAPVRRSAPSALAQSVSECASAPIEGALHSLAANVEKGERAIGALIQPTPPPDSPPDGQHPSAQPSSTPPARNTDGHVCQWCAAPRGGWHAPTCTRPDRAATLTQGADRWSA